MGKDQLMVLPSSTPLPTAPQTPTNVFAQLLVCKASGRDWLRQYEIPGRKALLQILANVYALYVQVDDMADVEREALIARMRAHLKADGKNVHADTPCASIMLRVVFPSLDKTRVSRWGSTLQAVRSRRKSPANFVEFVEQCGGIAKVTYAPVTVLVPGKPAASEIPPSTKEVTPGVESDEDCEISDEELEELEYGDELQAYLESRRSTPLVVVPHPGFAVADAPRVILVAELVAGELRIYEHVPYVEQALNRAFRERFATPDLLRQATKLPIPPELP